MRRTLRSETNKIKKIVLDKIALVMQGTVLGRRAVVNSKYTIFAWASKDYEHTHKVYNWYGFFDDEFRQIENAKNPMLLFTTGKIENFLLIPYNNFKSEIKPYLRKTKQGYFFLILRENNKWCLPLDYIPKNLRNQINGNGVPLDKYANELSYIEESYSDYLGNLGFDENKKDRDVVDTDFMIKTIAEKDPYFFTKSLEEKMIIIRYNQIKG